jgi:hypothetical protein
LPEGRFELGPGPARLRLGSGDPGQRGHTVVLQPGQPVLQPGDQRTLGQVAGGHCERGAGYIDQPKADADQRTVAVHGGGEGEPAQLSDVAGSPVGEPVEHGGEDGAQVVGGAGALVPRGVLDGHGEPVAGGVDAAGDHGVDVGDQRA